MILFINVLFLVLLRSSIFIHIFLGICGVFKMSLIKALSVGLFESFMCGLCER